MSQIDLWLALVGGLVLALGFGTGFLRSRGYLPSEPSIAVLFGVLVGPSGLGVLHLPAAVDSLWLLEQLARFAVAIAVTSIALRLPPEYYGMRARSLATVLGPGMVAMWLASALVAHAVLSVDPLVALLVGAVVTPTDPVLANSIVVGETAERNIPVRLRYFLSGEAGINDGTAYLFVFLPILLLEHPIGSALSEWLLHTMVGEVGGALAIGFVVGALAGRFERWERTFDFLEETSAFTLTVALTFAVLGVVELLGGVDILAVFVAGVAYNWQADPADEVDEQRVEEVFNRLLTFPVFVVFGMVLPWRGWLALGTSGLALVAGVLLLRRLPMTVALRRFIAPLDRREATLFVGWFGPIGLAAVFYALLARTATGSDVVWITGSLVVFSSVLIHGATATVATHWYGRIDDADESW